MAVKITFQGVLPQLSGFRHADKVTHAIYGAVIGAIAGFFALKFALPVYIIALAAATLAGIAKEVYDAKISHGEWDIWDIVATMAIPFIALVLQ